MILSRHLDPQCVAIIEPPLDKDGILHKIAELSVATGKLRDLTEELIFRALKERENQGATSFGSGIAVPHCNFEGIDSFIVGLLILKNSKSDFDAPDKQPVDLCFFIIGDHEARDEHIQILSSITRFLNTTSAAPDLRKARWADDAYSILVGSVEFDRQTVEQPPASMLSVAVEDEEIFTGILELFTAEPDSSLTVFEGNSAGRYLHHLPLYTSFWNDEHPTSIKVIQAILKTSAMNNMIRRINAMRDTSQPDSGVLIMASELTYWSGGLSY